MKRTVKKERMFVKIRSGSDIREGSLDNISFDSKKEKERLQNFLNGGTE